MRKAPKGGKLHPEDEKINRIIAKVRARVEHPFRILKRQFGYVKTRYRGLAKNPPSSSRCSRWATCSWSGESGWHEHESARKQACRRKRRSKTAKPEFSARTGRRRDAQKAISAKPKSLIRRSSRVRST
jgi:hypothetical protein